MEETFTAERVQKYELCNKSRLWQFLKVLPDLHTKAKVKILSICTLLCQELINLGSDVSRMENSAGKTGYPQSCCTRHQGPPVSHRLWEVGEHLVKFIFCLLHHRSYYVTCVCFKCPSLSPTQHLWNIRMLHNDWVESKNQATHVELWETTCGRKK